MGVEIQKYDTDRRLIGKEVFEKTTFQVIDVGKFRAMLAAMYGRTGVNVTVLYRKDELTGLSARLVPIDEYLEDESCPIRYCKVGRGGVQIRYTTGAPSASPLLVVSLVP